MSISKLIEKGKPIKLWLIVVPTIIIIIATIIILYFSGVFMTVSERTVGKYEREREGIFSGEIYHEKYIFEKSGKGKKITTDPDGYVATDNFSWYITEKNTLVIDGYIKYSYNSDYENYYSEGAKSTKNYWFVEKDGLHIGRNNSVKTEHYSRIK